MRKNALSEAAAEILAKSHSSAPAMPPQKLEGSEAQDLGGVTPTKATANKFEPGTSKATPPGHAPNVGAEPLHKVDNGTEIDPTASQGADAEEKKIESRVHAGLTSGDLKEEAEEEVEDDAEWKKNLQEDVEKIIASEDKLPAEFAKKIGTIYEARVTDKVNQIQEAIAEQAAKDLEAAVLEIRNELAESVNDYLNYVVEEWMKANELAVESGLRTELTEEFIGGLRNLFLEHYIDIPAEKVDVVDELASKVEELTSKLNEEVAKGIELSKQLSEAKKAEILQGVCEGLTQTQTEKIRSLVESVEFTAEGDYKERVRTIRENYFPVEKGKPADTKVLTEASEPLVEDEKKKQHYVDPAVAAVAAAIGKTNK